MILWQPCTSRFAGTYKKFKRLGNSSLAGQATINAGQVMRFINIKFITHKPFIKVVERSGITINLPTGFVTIFDQTVYGSLKIIKVG